MHTHTSSPLTIRANFFQRTHKQTNEGPGQNVPCQKTFCCFRDFLFFSFYFLFWIIKPLIFVSTGKWWGGTPREPAENLNRVAPAGVSLVVTGCSQGPVGLLNSAGEKLSPEISHSASAFPGSPP